MKQLAHRQHEIVAVSRETAADLQRFFQIPFSRVTVIPNGLDHHRFNLEGTTPSSDRLPTRDGEQLPFFLYVARLEHPAKNHARLIAAFERFKAASHSSWQLVLCGSDWHGADVIHRLVRQSPYASDIHVKGFVPDDEVAQWYRAASALVYPSLFEGFGLPPLEAMACGCPVLASSIDAVSEVCGDAAILVDPHSVEKIAEGLSQIVNNPALRDQLRQAGLARAREFDWDNTADAILDVYAQAAARERPTATARQLATAG